MDHRDPGPKEAGHAGIGMQNRPVLDIAAWAHHHPFHIPPDHRPNLKRKTPTGHL